MESEMKTILVSLTNIERAEDAIEAAVIIGQEHDSHIIGYYPIPGASIMVAAAPGSYYPPDDRMKVLYQEHLPDVKAKFEDRLHRSGLSFEWREDYRYEPSLKRAILEHGRTADIIIMAHEKAGSKHAIQEAGFVADVIMGAGRPILVMPPMSGKRFKLDNIGIGWNASREACRAAFDSLPLLSSADNVNLAWVNPSKTLGNSGKIPGTELAVALARHDVKVTTRGLSNRTKTGKALASFAEEYQIDLLVLGAYGHSRLREQVLGGVTEYMLRNLPCPVLFAN